MTEPQAFVLALLLLLAGAYVSRKYLSSSAQVALQAASAIAVRLI